MVSALGLLLFTAAPDVPLAEAPVAHMTRAQLEAERQRLDREVPSVAPGIVALAVGGAGVVTALLQLFVTLLAVATPPCFIRSCLDGSVDPVPLYVAAVAGGVGVVALALGTYWLRDALRERRLSQRRMSDIDAELEKRP